MLLTNEIAEIVACILLGKKKNGRLSQISRTYSFESTKISI